MKKEKIVKMIYKPKPLRLDRPRQIHIKSPLDLSKLNWAGSGKLELIELNKTQCRARLSKDKNRIVFETENLNRYEVEPIRKLKNLIDGKVKSTRLTWIEPLEIDMSKTQSLESSERHRHRQRKFKLPPQHMLRFFIPNRPLTLEEIEEHRLYGHIPKGKKVQNPVRHLKLCVDNQTLGELIDVQRMLNAKTGENLTLSEVIRLMILEGLRVTKENEALKEGSEKASKEVSESSKEASEKDSEEN